MIVRYGRSVEDGFLPVFSVYTEEEAERLIALSCSKCPEGYFSQELAHEQTLENLQRFSNKLQFVYQNYMQKEKSA